jgi:hypothetical protein
MAGFTESAEGRPVRAFISYAHDSDQHVAAVRDLWIFLRRQGIDARLDRLAAERRQEWPIWMLEQVRDARFVLVVASPAYKRRSDGLAATDEGRGVQFEARLIREYFYRDQIAGMERFLPVLLPGVPEDCIPEFLSPTAATNYRVSSMTLAGSEALLRVLTGQPYEVEPPLGPVPMLAPRAVTWRAAPLELGDAVPAGQHNAEQSPRLNQVLGGPLVERRIPSVAIPPTPPYLARREILLAQARTTLLEPGRTDMARMVGLVGMGGVGKSVLARTLARDEQIRHAFQNRIFWIELGPAPDLLARQCELAEAFRDPRAPAIDWQQELARLNTLLAGTACLVILDNVWKREHLRAFQLLEPKSALLVTTRKRDVLGRSATIHEIGPLPKGPARQLLADWAGQNPDTLPSEAEEAVQECGGLPLALAIVGGMVADDDLPWAHVCERLRRADLDKLEINLDDYRDYKDLLRVIEASVSDLTEQQRDRYLELAVFDGRANAPVDIVKQLWRQADLNDLDTKELIRRLARRSLLQYDKATGTLTLHDLQFDYARHKLGDQRLQAHHARLAAIILNGWGGIDRDLLGLSDSSLQNPVDHYGILHLTAHLRKANQHGDIHRLLALNTATTAVPSRPTKIENAWYLVHDRIGEIAAYAGDVGLAWNLAKTSTDEASANGESAVSIGLEVRYALVTASIASIAANIPPQLLVALVECGHWTAEQGLAYARQVPIAEIKAKTLVELLSLLTSATPPEARCSAYIDTRSGKAPTTNTDSLSPGEPVPVVVETAAEALAAARAIDNPTWRARILTDLNPQLPEPDRATVVKEAWDAICAIPPGQSQAKALAVLATKSKLPEFLQGQALAAARAIDDPSSRASILTALVAQLRGRDRAAVLKDAQATISEISQPEDRAAVLTALILQLRRPRRTTAISQAWDAIRAIPRGHSRTKALVALVAQAPQLPGPDRAVVVNDAQAAIRTISRPEDRAAALAALIPQLRGQDRAAAIKDTQAAISRISSSQPKDRADALTALISQLPNRRRAATVKLAQATISEISRPEDRAAVLTTLIAQLPEPYRIAAVTDAQASISRISQPEDRAAALTALALKLSEHDRAAILAQALAEARAINDARQRATTFTLLAPQLPGWNGPTAEWEGHKALHRALADARASGDPNSRAIALTILASLMPEADGSSVVRDALKEANGVGDAADRAAAFIALAPQIPEPGHSMVIDNACAAASEIRDQDVRADALTALVSKLPEALERQALSTAHVIDTTFTRSEDFVNTLKSCKLEAEDRQLLLGKILAAHKMNGTASPTFWDAQILSRFPRRKRSAVFKHGQDLIDAVSKVHSHATALAAMTSGNLTQPTEIGLGSAATAKTIARISSRAGDLNTLASELPEPLHDKMLIALQALGSTCSWAEGNLVASRLLEPDQYTTIEETFINESDFQGAVTALTFPLPEPERTAALNKAQDTALSICERSTQAAALVALIPHLPEEERVKVLVQALTAAKSIDEADRRAHILEAVAKHSLAGPMLPWEPYWRDVIEDAATRGRVFLISDLAAIGAVILRVGGSSAMQESINGLLDVGRWWP